jgi:hypothetical protein
MRPRIAWRVRRWSEGNIVADEPEIRRTYGDAVADHVALCRDLVAEQRPMKVHGHEEGAPTAQDVKATLRAIVERPTAADLSRLDSITEPLLLREAYTAFGVIEPAELAPVDLAACAAAALAKFDARSGAPSTDWIALRLVAGLIRLCGDMPRAQQDELMHTALIACGLGAGPKTIERLRTKAGHIL